MATLSVPRWRCDPAATSTLCPEGKYAGASSCERSSPSSSCGQAMVIPTTVVVDMRDHRQVPQRVAPVRPVRTGFNAGNARCECWSRPCSTEDVRSDRAPPRLRAGCDQPSAPRERASPRMLPTPLSSAALPVVARHDAPVPAAEKLPPLDSSSRDLLRDEVSRAARAAQTGATEDVQFNSASDVDAGVLGASRQSSSPNVFVPSRWMSGATCDP